MFVTIRCEVVAKTRSRAGGQTRGEVRVGDVRCSAATMACSQMTDGVGLTFIDCSGVVADRDESNARSGHPRKCGGVGAA